MATIHIREILRLLAERGETDALPNGGGMFVEIFFDEPSRFGGVVMRDFANKVLTAGRSPRNGDGHLRRQVLGLLQDLKATL